MTKPRRTAPACSTVVLEEEVQEDLVVERRQEDQRGELYPLALLKIAMAMKSLDQNQEMHFQELMDRVLADMIVDREDFAKYVQRNMSRLVTEVRERNY